MGNSSETPHVGSREVYLVDPAADFARSIAELLERASFSTHIFADAQSFLSAYDEAKNVSCMITDLILPDLSGLDLQRSLTARAATAPLVFVAREATVQSAVLAMRAGAYDFLVKPVDPPVLMKTIQEAIRVAEQRIVDATNSAHRLVQIKSLTPRERQILQLVVQGFPSKSIATELRLSKRTIDAHRAHIMSKLGADSVADLVRTVLLHACE